MSYTVCCNKFPKYQEIGKFTKLKNTYSLKKYNFLEGR